MNQKFLSAEPCFTLQTVAGQYWTYWHLLWELNPDHASPMWRRTNQQRQICGCLRRQWQPNNFGFSTILCKAGWTDIKGESQSVSVVSSELDTFTWRLWSKRKTFRMFSVQFLFVGSPDANAFETKQNTGIHSKGWNTTSPQSCCFQPDKSRQKNSRVRMVFVQTFTQRIYRCITRCKNKGCCPQNEKILPGKL